MNIECDKCHAHNHAGGLVFECVNCRADLSNVYIDKIYSKKYFLKNLVKMIVGAMILTVVLLVVYEFQLRKKIFTEPVRHSHEQEYQAINECISNIQVNSGKQEERLSICLQALRTLQTERPDLSEINPRMLKGYADVILSEK